MKKFSIALVVLKLAWRDVEEGQSRYREISFFLFVVVFEIATFLQARGDKERRTPSPPPAAIGSLLGRKKFSGKGKIKRPPPHLSFLIGHAFPVLS
jgi:hypothetical protein